MTKSNLNKISKSNQYFISFSDEKAFGLDKSDVVVEQIPLVYQPVQKVELIRNEIN